MREILFRGKKVGTEIWEYGGFTEGLSGYFIISAFEYNRPEFSEYVSVAPETVGQFTGLKAKCGAFIFEGDYITTSKMESGVVVFKDSGFKIDLGYGKGFSAEYDLFLWCGIMSKHQSRTANVTLHGNIHDNPELLKESD